MARLQRSRADPKARPLIMRTGSEPRSLRDRWMAREGYTMMRFANEEVFGNVEGVVTAIARLRVTGPPLTPPAGGTGIG